MTMPWPMIPGQAAIVNMDPSGIPIPSVSGLRPGVMILLPLAQ